MKAGITPVEKAKTPKPAAAQTENTNEKAEEDAAPEEADLDDDSNKE